MPAPGQREQTGPECPGKGGEGTNPKNEWAFIYYFGLP